MVKCFPLVEWCSCHGNPRFGVTWKFVSYYAIKRVQIFHIFHLFPIYNNLYWEWLPCDSQCFSLKFRTHHDLEITFKAFFQHGEYLTKQNKNNMIRYIPYMFYHKKYECQSSSVGQSHKSILRVFSTKRVVRNKGINILCAWFVNK